MRHVRDPVHIIRHCRIINPDNCPVVLDTDEDFSSAGIRKCNNRLGQAFGSRKRFFELQRLSFAPGYLF